MALATVKATPEKLRKPRPIKAKQSSPLANAEQPYTSYCSPPGPKLQYYPTPTPPLRSKVSSPGVGSYGRGTRNTATVRFLQPQTQSPSASRPSSRASIKTEESEEKDGELREVVEKFSRDQKSSREVLFLQQQLYQEDQLRHACDMSSPDTYDEKVSDRSECYTSGYMSSAGSWRLTSPRPSPTHHDLSCCSPRFRLTPGANRPNSRSSSGSSRCGSPYFNPTVSGSMFQPIRVPSPLLSAADLCSPISEGMMLEDSAQLMVSNLDYNISAREWKKILFSEFQQHVTVLGVHIQTQPDNTNIGFVRVPTIDNARYAISQFHRKKIGYKRIHVALVSEDTSVVSSNARSEVVALLKEVNGQVLPLFKFIEMFEKRYHRNISVSELYRMRDTVQIEDQQGAGRTVNLIPGIMEGVPDSVETSSTEGSEVMESPICRLHCEEGSAMYMEALDASALPNIAIQLRSFSSRVHTLLQTHDGDMPLMSFPSCYAAEFGHLDTNVDGVPLEHLVSCVPGVKIVVSRCGIKKVQWCENKPPSPIASELIRGCTSPLLSQQLSQFSREVIDLLKHSPQCRMAFSKFIPAYHHHFGRQCRVADYGYTKLMELFEAIPHIVQVIGGGSRRMVTLSHRAQVKRFTSDLLRVLKSQASKQISVLDLPIVYNKVIAKPFCITEYGVSYIEDMLAEVPETTMVVTGVGQEMVIAIPRRDQTPEEIERVKQFAVEVIDLLKHSPQCRMPFNKFIPAYHHHFGKQCRVSDYGFTKLIELFEAIPHVLQVLEEDEEKHLALTDIELLKVLEEQVLVMLRSCPNQEMPVPEFLSAFMRYHGHSIRLSDYSVASVMELIDKIPNVAKVETREGKLVIVLVDHSHTQQLANRILLVLMDNSNGSMRVPDLSVVYQSYFGYKLNMTEVCSDLQGIVQVTGSNEAGVIKLCPLQMFARDARTLLHANQGKLGLNQFEAAYAQHFGVALVPASYGYPSVAALLQAIPHVITVRGKGYRRTILLAPEFQGRLGEENKTLSSPVSDTTEIREGKSNTPENDSGINESHDFHDDEEKDLILHGSVLSRSASPYDMIIGRVPSNLPSPDLEPVPEVKGDLIKFDSAPSLQEFFSGLTKEERNGQQTPLCQTPVTDMLQFAAQLLPVDSKPAATAVVKGPNADKLPKPKFNQNAVGVTATPVVLDTLFGAAAAAQYSSQPKWNEEADMASGDHTNMTPRKSNYALPSSTPDSAVFSSSAKSQSMGVQTFEDSNSASHSSPFQSSDDSQSSVGSPQHRQGTPRKCRIAARFRIPISPAQDDN